MEKEKTYAGFSISRETKIQSTGKTGWTGYTFGLRCLYFFLCMTGSLWMVRDSLSLPVNMLQAAAILLVFTAVEGAVLLLPSWRKPAQLICWLLFAWGLAGLRERIAGGYLAAENCVREQLNNHYGFTLAARAGESPRDVLLLVCAVYGALILLLGKMVLTRGRTALLALVQVMITALLLICGVSISSPGLLVAGGSVLLLYVMAAPPGSRNGKIQRRAGLLAGLLLVALGWVAARMLGPVIFERVQPLNVRMYTAARDIQSQFNDLIQNGWPGQGAATLSGRLTNSSVDQDGKTDLVVTLQEQPQSNVYLRGYVGDTYEGTYWHQADEEQFRETFSGEQDAWVIQNLLYLYVGNTGTREAQDVTVEKVRGGGDYGYVPYGFQTPDDENLRGDAYYGSTADQLAYEGYVNWQEMLEWGGLSEEASRLEEIYRNYVAGQYLKVPVDNMDRLKEYCGQREFSTLQEIIDFVVSSVQEGHRYSMDLEPVPEGTDFAEYFFFDQKSGYCIHFATTATLMFRMMGVPARYVTGYVVPSADFSVGDSGYTAQVPDTQAHAWVEIYQNGIGWIPLEVTPGYGDSLETESQLPEASRQIPTPLPSATATPTPVQETVTPQPTQAADPQAGQQGQEETAGQSSQNGHPLAVAAAVVAAAALAMVLAAMVAMAFAAYRKSRIQARRRRFGQKNFRAAVREISREMSRILEDGGFSLTGNDPEDARRLEQEIFGSDGDHFTRFLSIAQKASYSREAVTGEERSFCDSLYHKTAEYQWKHLPKRKRFWWKYMKCHETS